VLSVILLLVFIFLAYKAAPRENKEQEHLHGVGQIGLLAALALFGVDYFTSYYYAAGEMLHALHPYGLEHYGYLTAGIIAFANLVFGGLYMYSLGPFNEGGGSYTASMRYLAPTLSLIVAITLIEDYILTIVVSALSGGDQLLSILNAYDASWPWHFALGALMAVITWYLTIRGRGESAQIVFSVIVLFVLLTIVMAIGLILASSNGVPAAVSEEAVEVPTLGQAILHMITASMKGMVALTGLEAVSNGIQFMIDQDAGIVKWGKKHLPRLKKIWAFYSGRSGIGRFVQTSFLFYGGITTFFLTFFALHFNVFDGTLGRTLVGNLAFIGFGQFSGGTILFWTYQILAVVMLSAASMTAFQDAQATEWRDVAIGEIPEAIIYRDPRGTFTRSVTITFAAAVLIMLLVQGRTSVAIPFYGIGVFLPITIMGLAVRKHVLEHSTGRTRIWGARVAGFAALLASVVFIGQIVGKWEEGGWIRLITFTTLFAVAHLILISPVGYRDAKQVARIVREKARVEGGMASIVEWQAFKMQEYRYKLLISIFSILEFFGIRQMTRRRLAVAIPGAGGLNVPQMLFLSRAGELTGVKATGRRGKAGNMKKEPQEKKLEHYLLPPRYVRHRILVPVNGVHQGTLTSLRYAHSLSDDVTAVHVTDDPEETEKLKKDWAQWGEGVRLVVLDSPHNMVLEPLIHYIQKIMDTKQINEIITVVVPQLIRPRWWSNLTRTQLAALLRMALPFETGIVITDVPYSLETEEAPKPASTDLGKEKK
jgi:hypothetical protein